MNMPLLQTKLFVPQLRSDDIIPRPQFGAQLQWPSDQKLTLVAAPAGFGKTTLIAAWLMDLQTTYSLSNPARDPEQTDATNKLCCAWLSLDENDNEVNRFLTYWVAAIQRADPSLGQEAAAMLAAPEPLSATKLLTSLINDLADYPHPLIIILDDYHVIREAPLHEAITFWLDYAPPHCHLVLTTRTEPPLPLALWRSQGQVNEIRADDLRFSEAEIGHFFQQVMDITLSDTNTEMLAGRTEGWIAGLKMAGLSMRGRDDVSVFIEQFSGSHRFIIDYLADQVLDRCAGRLREFLLHTSVLERMCAPLVDALLPDLGAAHPQDSQAILEELDATNLFVVPLDHERHWYRYHHLFGDLLQHRLRREFPGLEKHLHYRASVWYEQTGQMIEAVNHALAAEDFDRAAALIEPMAHSMAYRMEVETLGRWVEALPDDLLLQYPGIIYPYTITLSLTSRFDEYQHYLEKTELAAQANIDQPESQMLLGQVGVQRSIRLHLFGEYEKALQQVAKTETILRQYDQPDARWELISIRGYSTFYTQGEVKEAVSHLDRAIQLSTTDDGPIGVLLCNTFMANAYICLGQLRQAALLLENALQAVTKPDGSKLFPAVFPSAILGRLAYERNQLDEATQQVEAYFPLTDTFAFTTDPVDTLFVGTMLPLAQGDTDKAITTLKQEEQQFQALPISDTFALRLAALKALLSLRLGDLEAAAQWADTVVIPEDVNQVQPFRTFPYLVWARIRLAQRDFGPLNAVLTALRAWAEAKQLHGIGLEITILQALSEQAQDRTQVAIDHLNAALNIAASEGYVRLFLDEGKAMQQLLRQAIKRGIAVDYANQLLAAFDGSAVETEKVARSQESNTALIEPLSPRELEVLHLIDAGHTNQQLANELIIAVSTVKRHINNIYGKLCAQNRTHALARARELNLL